MKNATLIAVAMSAALSGCASHSDSIAPAYVSPMQYSSYTCKQIEEESMRVSARAATAAGAQDSKATSDAVATTVGVVIFWPALFLIKGDGVSASEVARLRGEMDALESASIQKKCGLTFAPRRAS